MKYSGDNLQHSFLYDTLLKHLSDNVTNRYRMAEYLGDNYNSCVLINDKKIEWSDLSLILRISDDRRMDFFILTQEDGSKFLSSNIITSRIVDSREQFYETVFDVKSKKFEIIFNKLPENIRQVLLDCDLILNTKDSFYFECELFDLTVLSDTITLVLGSASANRRSFVSNMNDKNTVDQLIYSLKDFV